MFWNEGISNLLPEVKHSFNFCCSLNVLYFYVTPESMRHEKIIIFLNNSTEKFTTVRYNVTLMQKKKNPQ